MSKPLTINDILTAPTGIKRPDHPDFWKLSAIILGLKADKEEHERGRITMDEFEHRWRANYDSIGDFDSIAYSAIQAAFALHNIETSADWRLVQINPKRHMAFVQTVQAYFDGFIMGARLERSREPECPFDCDNCRED